MESLNKKIVLPDPQNIWAVKQFRLIHGDDLYVNMVNESHSYKMHPGQRRIKKKKIETIEENEICMKIDDDFNDYH